MAGIFTGSSLAREIFGQTVSNRTVSENQPLQKHQFLLKVKYDPLARALVETLLGQSADSQEAFVKSVSMPSMSIDTDTMHEYNRKRISQTKINYNPVTVTMHDVVGGKSMDLWRLYYMYYFNDGAGLLDPKQSSLYAPPWAQVDPGMLAPDSIANSYMNDGSNIVAGKSFGYSNPYMRYVIKSLEIWQIHGSKYNKVTIFNPRISDFSHDTLSYDSSETVEVSFKFDYEWVEYEYNLEDISEDDLEGFFEQSKVIDYAAFDSGRTNTPRYTGEVIGTSTNANLQSPLSAVAASAQVTSTANSQSLSTLGNQVNVDSIDRTPTPVPLPPSTDFSVGTTATSPSTGYNDINRAERTR